MTAREVYRQLNSKTDSPPSPDLPKVSSGPQEVDTSRVGRWMSPKEYQKMVETGQVQTRPEGKNVVHVAFSADIEAFRKQAPKGSLYVEFDVASDVILPAGRSDWKTVNGPGSLLDRLKIKKGQPGISEPPRVTNIEICGEK